MPHTSQRGAKVIHDFAAAKDPNHVILVSVPGRETVATYSDQRIAVAFGTGYMTALKNNGLSPS